MTDDYRLVAHRGIQTGHLATPERVLVAELQHRTRNLLGVVRAIASKTPGELRLGRGVRTAVSRSNRRQGCRQGGSRMTTLAGRRIRIYDKPVEPTALAGALLTP
ncbi:MAG TPA: hypothetical protein VF516_16265 [Kofleriaceae bacterium]